MSADITTIGLAVDSTQVETATKKLDSFAESGKEAEKAAQGLGKATQGSAAGVKTAAQAADLAARQQAFLARSTDAVGSSTKKADGELRALIKSVENARNAYAKVKGSADGFAASLKEIAASSGKAVGELSKADYDEIAGGFSAVAASLGKIGQASGQATTAVKLMAERYIAQATGMAGTNVRMAASFAGALGKLAQLSPTLAVAAGSAAAAAAGVALFGVAMFKAEQESSAFASALIMSGNAAGSTVDQLNSMAAAVDGVVGTQAQAASAIAKLAASGKFAAGEIQLLAEAAVGLEQIGGQAVEKTVEQFVELEKDPVNALLKLNEQTRFMTAELFNNVKALQDQGREAEASAAAQQAYASALKSRTAEMAANLGTLERAWLGVKTAAAEAWDAILAVGRPATQADALQKQKDKLSSYQAEMAEVAASRNASGQGPLRAALSALATALETTISIAESDVRTTKQATAAQATATEQAQKYGLAVQARSQYMEESAPKAERMAKAIEKARREMEEANKVASAAGNEPVWTKKEMEQRLKAIGESFADTGKKAKTSAQEAADAYEKLAKTLGQDIVKATNESMEGYNDLNAAQKKFLDIATSPAWAEMTDEQRRGRGLRRRVHGDHSGYEGRKRSPCGRRRIGGAARKKHCCRCPKDRGRNQEDRSPARATRQARAWNGGVGAQARRSRSQHGVRPGLDRREPQWWRGRLCCPSASPERAS
ncbi:MAG: phage tail length tape measure family protein [Opitutaceae bacterium]|nr:phage tail length tape measure family protein [Opitutaceae bacterium]